MTLPWPSPFLLVFVAAATLGASLEHQFLHLEAERGHVVAPMQVKLEPPQLSPVSGTTGRASNGSYVIVATNNAYAPVLDVNGTYVCQVVGTITMPNNDGTATGGFVQFVFVVSAPALFRLTARLYAPSSAANSFFVTLVGAGNTTVIPRVEWNTDSGRFWQTLAMPRPFAFLPAGVTSLVVQYRELDVALDWVELTTDFDPPALLDVSGCSLLFNAAANASERVCATDGLDVLTILGYNLGVLGSVSVTIDAWPCEVLEVSTVDLTCSGLVSVASADSLRCQLPRIAGAPRSLVVTVNAKSVSSTVLFASPRVDLVVGCGAGALLAAASQCPRGGGSTIEIHGANFGYDESSSLAVRIGTLTALNARRDTSHPNTLVLAELPPGSGESLSVVVLVDGIESPRAGAQGALSYELLGCEKTGCVHGHCSALSLSCVCPSGFVGKTCETSLVLSFILPIALAVFVLCVCTCLLFKYRQMARSRVHTFTVKLDKAITVSFDELTIDHALGAGSFGDVYLATWRGCPVAVKQFRIQKVDAGVLTEFSDETKVMFDLRHPSIVMLMGACAALPDLALVLEYLPNGNLLDALGNRALAIKLERRMLWALQIAQAIVYLHACGIVHRDVKTPNVLLTADWNCKVTDFGMSKLKSAEATSSHPHIGLSGALVMSSPTRTAPSNKTACALGSAFWAAPEAIRDPSNVTFAVDVYAFGIVLWELASRATLYPGLSPMTVASAVADAHLRPPAADPKARGPEIDVLLPLMELCWAANPDDRPTFASVVTRLSMLDCDKHKFRNSFVPLPHFSERLPAHGFMFSVVASLANLPLLVDAGLVTPEMEASAVDAFLECTQTVVREIGATLVGHDGLVATIVCTTGQMALQVASMLSARVKSTRLWPGRSRVSYVSDPSNVSADDLACQNEIASSEQTSRLSDTAATVAAAAVTAAAVGATTTTTATAFATTADATTTTVGDASRSSMDARPTIVLSTVGGRVGVVNAPNLSFSEAGANFSVSLVVLCHAGLGRVDPTNGVVGEYVEIMDAALATLVQPGLYVSSLFASMVPDLPPVALTVELPLTGAIHAPRPSWHLLKSDLALGDKVYQRPNLIGYAARLKWPHARDVVVEQLTGQDRVPAEMLARARHEARALAGLDSPHLCALVGVVTTGRKLSLVYESLASGMVPLASVLDKFTRQPTMLAVMILQVVASALATLHKASIVHGDVCPTTIFIRDMSRVQLLSAGFVDAKLTNATMTVTAIQPHTAPELVKGGVPTAASDVYALGMLGYQLLTGVKPYADVHLYVYLREISDSNSVHRPRFRDERVSALLRSTITRCSAVDAGERMPARDALAALLQVHAIFD